jgi:arabinose-5-phosphate isomerase
MDRKRTNLEISEDPVSLLTESNMKAGELEEGCLAVARRALLVEAESIRAAADRLDGGLTRAVRTILSQRGKIVVTGIGKSGHIGHKIAATFCSTGSPAVFLHATEAVHGDLGIYSGGDPTILISKSGATVELLRLIPILRSYQSPLIGIVGNINSPIARQVDVLLDARVDREADPLNLAPTSSSTVALAIGDALACALMHARGFKPDDFARNHPEGQLGRNLLLRVEDVMHTGDEVAWVKASDSLRLVVIAMTRHPLGAALVIDAEGHLVGMITDGDVRRFLEAHDEIRGVDAQAVMRPNPITVQVQASLRDAVDLMENRTSQISVLPVLDNTNKCLGVLRLHDIYQAELR